ncbi:hypothetical protein D9758_001797 [Tetrapyrgos nigripes]|uniref:Uncharacterized protein n=1 Tax=Tetrapyrgos nigripes TaxID=182062 RepID=A0A8H5LVI5_9AGAR|nr:hypothetical protein D9758_001797 [Tetrapyrgos nigripes]
MSAPHAGSSTPRKLIGPIPGILDPSQPQRLLRFPSSRLSFASFHPLTATSSAEADFRKLSLGDEFHNAKRVVIETAPTGESYWRFVPKASRDEGVIDEGDWPRLIDLCGQLVECYQDQWDIHKLDPFYECRVRIPPALSVITYAPKPHSSPLKMGKRAVSSEHPPPPLNRRRKLDNQDGSTRHTSISLDDEDNDEDEVEEMVIDEMPPPRGRSVGASNLARKKREEISKNRQERRGKATRRVEKLNNPNESNFYFDFGSADSSPSRTQSVPPQNGDPNTKRKASHLADPLRTPDEEYVQALYDDRNPFNYHADKAKRTRTVSPTVVRRQLDAMRMRREKKKVEKREAKLFGRRQRWHEEFMREVYAEVPDMGPLPGDDYQNGVDENDVDEDVEISDSEDGPDSSMGDQEEEARRAAIAESRRKLAELEQDRPIWEAEARKRAMREKAEEEARRLQAEQRKWAEARLAEEEKQRKAAAAQAQAEAERRAKEEKAQRQQERRQRHDRWTNGAWSNQRALERYRALGDVFDTFKYSVDEPISFDEVPWPVLKKPSLSVEDIDWASVEQFFDYAKTRVKGQDYKTLLEKSHRRFHPDRWRSRNLIKTVEDELERDALEVAANTVAQAITPIWKALR